MFWLCILKYQKVISYNCQKSTTELINLKLIHVVSSVIGDQPLANLTKKPYQFPGNYFFNLLHPPPTQLLEAYQIFSSGEVGVENDCEG